MCARWESLVALYMAEECIQVDPAHGTWSFPPKKISSRYVPVIGPRTGFDESSPLTIVTGMVWRDCGG